MMGRRFLLTSVAGPRLLLCPAPGFKAVASERGLESALQPQRLPQARAAQVQAVGGPIRVTELVLDLRGVQRLSAGAARRPAAVAHVQLRGRVERQPTVVELAHDHEAKALVVHPVLQSGRRRDFLPGQARCQRVPTPDASVGGPLVDKGILTER
jgi:hypothetical protein